jgi:hypothetical protein
LPTESRWFSKNTLSGEYYFGVLSDGKQLQAGGSNPLPDSDSFYFSKMGVVGDQRGPGFHGMAGNPDTVYG